MNRRLYFVLPDVDISRQIENDLLLAHISDDHMHFLGKRGTDLLDLPEATSAQKTDLVHGIFIGLMSGAAVGAIIGLILYLFRDYIFPMEIGVVLLFFILGGIFGAWVSGMLIGTSTPNVKLKEFEQTMQEGHILLMLDVPVERVDEIRKIILTHHPEAEDHGKDPTIPAFP
ncbi:MAG: DUF1269 domain-containing protein [Gammaproteobacteria bacterium]|nr:DUF1269 domain-containing protein [Gammaproteobacteria bacterium]